MRELRSTADSQSTTVRSARCVPTPVPHVPTPVPLMPVRMACIRMQVLELGFKKAPKLHFDVALAGKALSLVRADGTCACT